MIKHKHTLFPFLYDPEFLLTIVATKGLFRNVELKMKTSGQFKSLHQECAIIRSVIDSAIKNGKSIFHTINGFPIKI